ncbi:hypothetical protein AB0M87_24145 [Streptomyces sp. NPDC051320]|uniref:hypothetical protein n=1 Tax=Streptomyces sp. NPDC051320 TaxID=3154644 RepID=UPI00342FF719
MNSRRRRQVLDAATTLLIAGEQIEFTGLAKVGTVSVKRQVLTSALVGVLSAGTVIATVQPRPMYLALTDRRLLFLDGATTSGKPGKPLMSLERGLLAAAPLTKALLGLGLKTVITVQGETDGLKLVFPPAFKADGRELVTRLPVGA